MTNSAGPEFVLGGNRGDSTSGTIMNGQGGGGSCWSTNAGPSNDLAYRLALYAASQEVRPAHLDIYKLSAISLRCLAPVVKSIKFNSYASHWASSMIESLTWSFWHVVR